MVWADTYFEFHGNIDCNHEVVEEKRTTTKPAMYGLGGSVPRILSLARLVGFLERVNALAPPKYVLHYPSEASRPRTSTKKPPSESARQLSTIGERFEISRDIRALHFYFYPREHHLKLQAPYFGAQPCSRRCWRLRIRMLCGMHSQANHHYHAPHR
jgi:hypothetical protein